MRTVFKALCKLVTENEILLGERGHKPVVNVGLVLGGYFLHSIPPRFFYEL